jgi:RNA polymerase sigma-70 factor (ECF subfamily)
MSSSLTPVPGVKKQGAKLLVAVHGGADGALSQLLELYRPYLLAIANQEFDPALRGKAGPSDLVQETLVRATKRLPVELPQDESEFRAWLRKILIRRLDSLRKRYRGTAKRQIRRERSLDDVDVRDYLKSLVSAADQTPGSQAAANERREQVQQALKRLPKEYRTMIFWHNRDGLGWTQIALKLDRSPDAARMLWKRAVQQLANILRDKSEPS